MRGFGAFPELLSQIILCGWSSLEHTTLDVSSKVDLPRWNLTLRPYLDKFGHVTLASKFRPRLPPHGRLRGLMWSRTPPIVGVYPGGDSADRAGNGHCQDAEFASKFQPQQHFRSPPCGAPTSPHRKLKSVMSFYFFWGKIDQGRRRSSVLGLNRSRYLINL